jgi:hypothetical protein
MHSGSSQAGAETPPPVPALLDQVLPSYEFRGQTERVVLASPEVVFRSLREVTLAEMPLARRLGNLRYLPGRLLGRTPPADDARPFFEVAGLKPLLELPDREAVFVTIGRLHDITDQQVVPVSDLAAFQRFSNPDYQKLAISIRLEPSFPPGANRLIVEHRTLPLGPSGRWKFALYWWLMIRWTSDFMSGLLLDAVVRRAEDSLSPR